MSTEPEPDPAGQLPAGDRVGGERAPRGYPWRVAAVALIIVLGMIGVWVLSGSYTPAGTAVCDALRVEAVERQDITVVYEMDRLGCPNPPYDAVRWR